MDARPAVVGCASPYSGRNSCRRVAGGVCSQAREKSLAKAHQEYLDDHPEIRQLLNDFISTALVEQPVDVFEFAREHFKGTVRACPMRVGGRRRVRV